MNEPINREPENGHEELYFNHKPYSIDPKNMDKRVRVFINQLIPDVVREIQQTKSTKDIISQTEILRNDYKRFSEILKNKGMEKELDEVDYAIKVALVKIFNRFNEVIYNARE